MDHVLLEDGMKAIELSEEARRSVAASCEPHPALGLT
jgi:hypothetical protein